jgi:hypothetical protein
MVVDSIVLNPSNALTNIHNVEGEVNQAMVLGQNVVQVGMVRTVFGPILPPAMIWEKNFQSVVFSLVPSEIPCSLPMLQFAWLQKGPWNAIFESYEAMVSETSSVLPTVVTVLVSSAARRLCFDNEMPWSTEPRNPTVFSTTPVSQLVKRKRGKGKKFPTPHVETDLRRSKRSCVRKKGFKHAAAGSSMQIIDISEDATKNSDNAQKMPQEEVIPETPIRMMQRVGEDLDIAPEKITEEKLKAIPKSKKSKKGANDK